MYGENIELEPGTEIKCSFFSADSRFGGAWIQFGPDATPSDYEELFAPQGNLLFSGSGSCRRYYGFGHGALLAGWRDGNKILEMINETYDTAYPVTLETRCEDLPSNNGNSVPRSKRFRGN